MALKKLLAGCQKQGSFQAQIIVNTDICSMFNPSNASPEYIEDSHLVITVPADVLAPTVKSLI